MMISRIRTTVISMTILATALVSTTAIAAQPQAEVISQSCTDAIHSTNYTLVSLRPVQPNSKLPIAAPGGGSSEKKTCETTNAPATNPQGVNGSNRCTTAPTLLVVMSQSIVFSSNLNNPKKLATSVPPCLCGLN